MIPTSIRDVERDAQRLRSYRRAERDPALGDEQRRRRYRQPRRLIEGPDFVLGVEHAIPRSVTSVTTIVDRNQPICLSNAPLTFRDVAA
jgi:hypothetical protein